MLKHVYERRKRLVWAAHADHTGQGFHSHQLGATVDTLTATNHTKFA